MLEPTDLSTDLATLEAIEKATLRLVTQAIVDFRDTAQEIYREEGDLVADIGEDITREALDRLGMAKIDQRLFGKMDYKRARYIFHSDYVLKQALFVDSKAEKVSGQHTATLQTSQFSMIVRQIRSGEEVEVPGKLPPVLSIREQQFLTTTVFVKYNYNESQSKNVLESISVSALPNGYLQQRYNPNHSDSIWLVGRNAPSLGEEFRVRLSLPKLKNKCKWRVQLIPMPPTPFLWEE